MGDKQDLKVLVIIPAKTDSKRLPGKNLKEINGKSLLQHTIDFAKDSKWPYLTICVSSESNEVGTVAWDNKVDFHPRQIDMCGDVEVVDVYRNVAKSFGARYDLVVGLQPDHPDRKYSLDHYISYMLDNNYDDLICIEPNYKRSGSVRIFKMKDLLEGAVSKRIGTIVDDATDIHYQADLDKAIKRMK